jgi:hypothetical protein
VGDRKYLHLHDGIGDISLKMDFTPKSVFSK